MTTRDRWRALSTLICQGLDIFGMIELASRVPPPVRILYQCLQTFLSREKYKRFQVFFPQLPVDQNFLIIKFSTYRCSFRILKLEMYIQ